MPRFSTIPTVFSSHFNIVYLLLLFAPQEKEEDEGLFTSFSKNVHLQIKRSTWARMVRAARTRSSETN